MYSGYTPFNCLTPAVYGLYSSSRKLHRLCKGLYSTSCCKCVTVTLQMYYLALQMCYCYPANVLLGSANVLLLPCKCSTVTLQMFYLALQMFYFLLQMFYFLLQMFYFLLQMCYCYPANVLLGSANVLLLPCKCST